MNILHVLSQFEVTGAEAYAATLVEQQAKQGHTLFVVSDTLTLPFQALCLTKPIGQRSYLRRFSNIRWLIKFIRENKIHIVHAHSRAASWVCYIASVITKTAFLSTIHGRQHVHASSKAFNVYGRHIIAVCESIKDHLVEELSIDAEKITMIPNGFPSLAWKRKPSAANKKSIYGVPEKTTVLAFIGRLSGPKGDVVRFLLQHILVPLSKLRRFVFFIIGGMKIPDDIPPLVETTNSSANRHFVYLKGFQENTGRYLAAADVVLGSGRVAIEALLLGKPVVAFGESQYVGTVTEKNLDDAIRTNFGDAGKFHTSEAERVLSDLRGILSKNVNRRLSKKIVEAVRRQYDIRTVERHIQQQYQQALIETKSPAVIPVLLYHRVVDALVTDRLGGLVVTVKQFEAQLQSLAQRGFITITFQEYAAFSRGEGTLPSRPIILTFDDGYEDNYTKGFPLLQHYGMKAVIYLVADRKRRTNFWDNGQPQVPLLTASQIAEMARAGIEFGSHTISHPHLPALTRQRVHHEVRKSKEMIEDLLGDAVLSFAYPFGELNPFVKALVAEEGYQYGVAADSGPVVFFQDPFQIRRIQVFPWTGSFGFWKKTQPWYPRYKTMKQQLA